MRGLEIEIFICIMSKLNDDPTSASFPSSRTKEGKLQSPSFQ